MVELQAVAAACYLCIPSLRVLKGQGLKSGLGLNAAFLNGNVSDVIACGQYVTDVTGYSTRNVSELCTSTLI